MTTAVENLQLEDGDIRDDAHDESTVQYINDDDSNARDESIAETTAADVDAQLRLGQRVTMRIPRAEAPCVIQEAQGMLPRPLRSTR